MKSDFRGKETDSLPSLTMNKQQRSATHTHLVNELEHNTLGAVSGNRDSVHAKGVKQHCLKVTKMATRVPFK